MKKYYALIEIIPIAKYKIKIVSLISERFASQVKRPFLKTLKWYFDLKLFKIIKYVLKPCLRFTSGYIVKSKY